ncbi:MAG TPA: FAD-binding domain [Polyangia bacterium]|nr:FAD-binding domain [Polyangia bacterium]
MSAGNGAGKSILISGAGIAGPALAYWLLRYGLQPTLIERAPRRRTGGYVIDFWGAGYDLTERMGLLPAVLQAGYQVKEVRLVGATGRRIGGFDVQLFREATQGRFTSLPRGDLAAILHRAIEGRAPTTFDDSVTRIEDGETNALVHFARGPSRRFDIVIGADGLHSVVRALSFGAESRFERSLGYTVAAFEVGGYRPRDEDVYLGYSVPGRQISRFSMRGDRTMFLFVAADQAGLSVGGDQDLTAQKAYLRSRFDSPDWECRQILAALEHSDDLYFDRVSQIRMEHWWKDHVALVGDAAFAPSLLAGQGSALAIIGGYVLAGEIARAVRRSQPIDTAFAAYERALRPFMLHKQDAAAGFAVAFAPRTRLGIFLRNQVTKLMALPYVAKLAFGSSLLDKIDLPDDSDLEP